MTMIPVGTIYMYDHEVTVTMSDWYHELVEDIPFIRVENPTGAEPVPDSFLFNDTLNTNIPGFQQCGKCDLQCRSTGRQMHQC
jgi:hypothetical protein